MEHWLFLRGLLMLNKIISWNLDRLPRDPLIVAQYMYYLQGIIVLAMFGFTINNIVMLFMGKGLYFLFGAILTGCFTWMSMFSYRASREGYYRLKNGTTAFNQAIDEITPEMLEKIRLERKDGLQKV